MSQFEGLELVKDDVKVTWEFADEGLSGDYNEKDPFDTALLRFSVYHKEDEQWEYINDSSYCTSFPLSAPTEVKMKGLETIMSFVYEKVTSGQSIKRLCEKLSYIDETCTVSV